MNIKLLYYKFRVKYLKRWTSHEVFNEILRMEGIEVGEGTKFFDPNSQTIDRERPWMLKIGKYCKITRGCTILAHDYSRSVLRRAMGEVIGEAGETIIGDNVFIGMHSTILMGAHIGNNVIIGAGSVVSGNIPDNCVAAGNPVRIIRTLEEHYEIRKRKSVNEAKLFAKTYKKRYGHWPSIKTMNAFFPLYMKRDLNTLLESGVFLNLSGDCHQEVIDDFLKSEPPMYSSYEDFINSIE